MVAGDRRTVLTNRRGLRMVADLTMPEASAAAPAVLVIHGLGGHRNERHIAAVARRIAERGIAALRLDLTNNAGESDGSFRDLTLSGEVDDAEDALVALAAMSGIEGPRLGAAGHSFGALVAMLLAARRSERVRALAVMSGVFDAPLRFRRGFAPQEAEWRRRGYIELGNNPSMALGVGFLDDLARWDIGAEAHRVRAPALIVHGDADAEVPPSEAYEYERHLPGKPIGLRLIRGADHTYTDPHALEEVADAVAAWFHERLYARP